MQDAHLSRRLLLPAGAAASGAGVAGCSGGEGADADGGDTATDDGSDDSGSTPDEAGTETPESDAYSVEMALVGEVTFETVPERRLVYEFGYADTGVALGRADGLTAVGNLGRYHTQYYDELGGVDVDTENLTQLIGDSRSRSSACSRSNGRDRNLPGHVRGGAIRPRPRRRNRCRKRLNHSTDA